MTRVLVAPDSFKGSLSALRAAEAIAKGVSRACPDCQVTMLPIADGGEGTLDALLSGAGGRSLSVPVRGPLGEEVDAQLGVLPEGVAVVEMAQASGLTLIASERRNPLLASSFGTGQLIRAALDQNCRQLVITIGGTATVDGGTGLLAALGARFIDADGQELPPIGSSLPQIAAVDLSLLDPRLESCNIRVASDVTNPLYGPEGAAAVFGPQKGATAEMVRYLDGGLRRLAEVTAKATGRDVSELSGGGAAGGVGAALVAYLGGQMQSGVQVVLDTLQADRHLRLADLVITGEGRMDAQTAHGKAPVGIALRGRQHGCRTIALVGSVLPGYEAVYSQGISAIFPIVNRPLALSEAMNEAAELLSDAAARAMHAWQAFRN